MKRSMIFLVLGVILGIVLILGLLRVLIFGAEVLLVLAAIALLMLGLYVASRLKEEKIRKNERGVY